MSAEVIAQLKKSDLSNYTLPWFMVLGPKHSGKSTLLHYSGLSFSWEHVSSENSQWLFSDKAIFVEVNFDIDKDEWMTLLAFLKKVRPKVPLNGILLVLSLPVDISVKTIREYLAEIAHVSGFLLPVTIIFTHLDTVVGFESYFRQSTEQLFQVHDDLYAKLFAASYGIAQSQDAINDKLNTLNFPEHFRRIEKPVKAWIDDLTKANPYQEMPDFRDRYFTSKAYFVSAVFDRVLQTVSDRNIKSRKHIWLTRWFTSISVIIASIIVLSVFLISSASFAHNTYKIHEGVSLGQLIQNSSNANDYINLVTYLSAKPPHALIPLLQTLLMNGLEQEIIPNMFNKLEDQLALTQEQWALATSEEEEAMRGEYYNQLKTYLMFCYPQYRYSLFYQGDLLMAFYLNHSHKNWSARADLIQLSRQQLYIPSNVNNMYAGIKSWGEKRLGFISASDLFGASLDESVKLPVFFTARGFGRYAAPEIEKATRDSAKGDWVMQAPPEFLKDSLLRLYKTDYKKSWILFLQNLRPAAGQDVSEKTVSKIIALAHQNILFKESHLDPEMKVAIENIRRLPQLTKIMAGVEAQWQSQVYAFYAQKLADKYPFYNSSEEVDPEDFNQFFDSAHGLLATFLHQNQGLKIRFSPEFMSSVLNFEIYPEPTLGLKEIRLVMNKQVYRYRNGPQEWQSLQWQLSSDNSATTLEIITSNGSVGSIEYDTPWGLFRLLQKAVLTQNSDGSCRARWKIRADNGHYYSVSFLLRPTHNNLCEVILFQHFRLPEELFSHTFN